MARAFRTGDCVVFRKWKQTPHPGRRARGVYPTPNGDNYVYFVEKVWVVTGVTDEGRLVLQTRRGKTHEVASDDPNLRHATLLDRIRYRARMSQLAPATS